jgi:hypothetical protein
MSQMDRLLDKLDTVVDRLDMLAANGNGHGPTYPPGNIHQLWGYGGMDTARDHQALRLAVSRAVWF